MARRPAGSALAQALKPFGVLIDVDGQSFGIKVARVSTDWVSPLWAARSMAQELRTLADNIERIARPFQDAQDVIDRAEHNAEIAAREAVK